MWKKVFFVMLLAMIATVPFLLAIDKPTVGSQESTPYGRWLVVAELPSAGAEPAFLSETERTYKLVQALILADVGGRGKVQVSVLDYGVNSVRFRLAGITDAGTIVTYVYSGAKDTYPDCDLVLRGILTFTVGTQVSIIPGYELADTMVITGDEATTKSWVPVSPANNTCAEGFIDLQGDDIVVTVGTTVTCDAKLLMKDF